MSALRATHPKLLTSAEVQAATDRRPRELEDANVRTVVLERRAVYMSALAIETKREALANMTLSEDEMIQKIDRREGEVEDFQRDFVGFLSADGGNTMELRAVAEKACEARLEATEKILEISRRLRALRVELARATEEYAACKQYRDFLCGLVPKECDQRTYWSHPQQLVRVMEDLEEANIFLMVHCEEAESTFRRVKGEFLDMMVRDERALAEGGERRNLHKGKLQELEAQVAGQLAAQDEEWGNELGETEFQELGAAVSECVSALGFCPGRADDRHSLLSMLAVIERSLEDFEVRFQRLDPVRLKRYARGQESQRREAEKRERAEQARREQEEKQSAARAAALRPIVRREGRPLCARSTPEKRETREAREEHLREQMLAHEADEALLFGSLPP